MAKVMKRTAVVTLLMTVCFCFLYQLTTDRILFSLAITSGTAAYHFIIRLFIGAGFNMVLNNKVDYTKSWFRVSKSEMKLYQKLKVKKWKNKMPTYDMDVFDVSKHSWEEIIQAMCQSELVHETNAVFSFLPVAASVYLGSFWVFMITSVLSAAFDLMFVCMQRFNRFRILKIKGKRQTLG